MLLLYSKRLFAATVESRESTKRRRSCVFRWEHGWCERSRRYLVTPIVTLRVTRSWADDPQKPTNRGSTAIQLPWRFHLHFRFHLLSSRTRSQESCVSFILWILFFLVFLPFLSAIILPSTLSHPASCRSVDQTKILPLKRTLVFLLNVVWFGSVCWFHPSIAPFAREDSLKRGDREESRKGHTTKSVHHELCLPVPAF